MGNESGGAGPPWQDEGGMRRGEYWESFCLGMESVKRLGLLWREWEGGGRCGGGEMFAVRKREAWGHGSGAGGLVELSAEGRSVDPVRGRKAGEGRAGTPAGSKQRLERG